ncbi:hypothetical protein J3R82DRAFT_3231 [Butyriboletus roseoflavus]|nr:hypothetical protein J3R82DRAFT_3231 [Butyriboletus roseoflavus]
MLTPFSFFGSSNEFCGDFPELDSIFMISPDHFFLPFPIPDPGYPWPLPSSSIANLAVASPSLNAYTRIDAHDWSSQPDIQSAQYHTPVFNPQNSGLMSTISSTNHRPSAILDAGSSSMSQGYSSAVLNGTTPVHDALYSPPNHISPLGSTLPSHHNSSPMLMFADQARLFNSEIRTPYEQILPVFAGLMPSFSSIPSNLAFQPMVPRSPIDRIQRRNSRRGSSITNSPYPPTRTPSLPVPSSPEEAVSHTCQWMKADGTICGAPITWAGVPKHLTTHGVENMANICRVSCRWLGCRIKGNNDTMNRESIVRHVRKKHLGHRRSL